MQRNTTLKHKSQTTTTTTKAKLLRNNLIRYFLSSLFIIYHPKYPIRKFATLYPTYVNPLDNLKMAKQSKSATSAAATDSSNNKKSTTSSSQSSSIASSTSSSSPNRKKNNKKNGDYKNNINTKSTSSNKKRSSSTPTNATKKSEPSPPPKTPPAEEEAPSSSPSSSSRQKSLLESEIDTLLEPCLLRITNGLPLHELKLIIGEATECEAALKKEIQMLEDAVAGFYNDDDENEKEKKQEKSSSDDDDDDDDIPSKLAIGGWAHDAMKGKSYHPNVEAMRNSGMIPLDRYFTLSSLLGRLRIPMNTLHPPLSEESKRELFHHQSSSGDLIGSSSENNKKQQQGNKTDGNKASSNNSDSNNKKKNSNHSSSLDGGGNNSSAGSSSNKRKGSSSGGSSSKKRKKKGQNNNNNSSTATGGSNNNTNDSFFHHKNNSSSINNHSSSSIHHIIPTTSSSGKNVKNNPGNALGLLSNYFSTEHYDAIKVIPNPIQKLLDKQKSFLNLHNNNINTSSSSSSQDNKKKNLVHEIYTQKTEESILLTIWKRISNHRTATVFRRPVSSKDAPTYHERIQFPMDLSLIKKMILAQIISSYADLHFSIGLICHNCVKFNGRESDYGQITREFEAYVDDALLGVVTNIANKQQH